MNVISYRGMWNGFAALILATVSLLPAVLIAEESADVQRVTSQIDITDLKRHVSALASDAFEGREAGSRGGKAALAYLRSELKRLRELGRIARDQSQDFGREYENLLVMLPGADERLKTEVIVIGAHYDHVGYGKPSNSQGPFGQIHNGADDNASGTSALLELIQAFSSLSEPPARSILFAFWDAEEAGLLGSKHWVTHPTVPLKSVRFAMNLDMLGRMRDGRVVTGGWRSATGLRMLLSSHNVTSDLKLAFQPKVLADSDHYSFYEQGIPIIHFDTDKHDDYHRPSDDPEKLNWTGLETIARFAFRITHDLANSPDLPRFRPEAFRETPPAWVSPHPATPPPVRLGVTWNAEAAKQNVAQISQVTTDSPAAKAGLQIGDRLIRLGNWENGSLEDIRTIMQVLKNPVSIRVARAGVAEPIDLVARLWGEPIRLGAGWVDDPAIPGCVAITHTVLDSPADRAGIAGGDVILDMGGRSISSADEMRRRVNEETGPFQFRVERNGRIRELTVDIMDRPTQNTVDTKSR